MCRLLYLPAGRCRTISVLKPWLTSLDRSQGGDGCGVAACRYGLNKGRALRPIDSARIIKDWTDEPIVWHARRVSCGPKTDELCHPFPTKPGSYLVHNGHWETGAVAAKLLRGDWSDTSCAALYIRLHGWEAFTQERPSGVWIHLTPEGRQVYFRSGSLYVETVFGALCSEPCKEWGMWHEAEPGKYDADEIVAPRLETPNRIIFRSHEGNRTLFRY